MLKLIMRRITALFTLFFFITLHGNALAVTPKELDAITQQFINQIEHSRLIMNDEEVAGYLTGLGKKLWDVRRAKYDRFKFFLVNKPTVNAFAGPGGYIGVHAGLILLTENEDELAAVIAHEMGHVKLNHLIRQLERMRAENISMTLASIAAIALGAYGSPELGQAAILTGAAGIQQMELNFSREQEQEADRYGLETLIKAGYSPQGMLDFFRRMSEQERMSFSSTLPDILKSHPVTEFRISDIENRVNRLKGKAPKASVDYEIFKARIAHLSQTEHKIHFQHQVAADYGRALILLEHARYKDIQPLLPSLLKYKSHPSIQGLLIDYYGATKQNQQIVKIGFEKNLAKHEFLNTKLYWHYLETEQYGMAIELVQTALTKAPNDPDVWFAYAEIENAMKHEAEAYLYRAKAMLCMKQKHEAQRLLEIAKSKKPHRAFTRDKINGLLADLKH